MIKKFGYKNIMEVPKLDKVVINSNPGPGASARPGPRLQPRVHNAAPVRKKAAGVHGNEEKERRGDERRNMHKVVAQPRGFWQADGGRRPDASCVCRGTVLIYVVWIVRLFSRVGAG